ANRPGLSIDDIEVDFKNIKQNNHLQTSFTAGNAMRPRQRMRTLRTNRREGKGFFKRLSSGCHASRTPPITLVPMLYRPDRESIDS
ncbi:hypothetical protein, partial [Cobetia amphilecti]|uniref:hypothetical protein n=1 Tax=Cobetia amphilecti TaxID=1055104 RepID=UPI003298B0F2